MKRGFLLVLSLLLPLPACRGTQDECKPTETVDIGYAKSFETSEVVQEDGRTKIVSRVTERTEVTITISYGQVGRTARWVPHESPAAVSVSRAIALATQWLARERSDDGKIKVSGTYLARYGCRGTADYWYHVVSFSPFSLGDDHFESRGASVAVLMDGTVIGPVMVK